MANLTSPVTLTFETTEELETIRRMFTTMNDMEGDMLLDEFFMSPDKIRQLGFESDSEIRIINGNNMRNLKEKIDSFIALKMLTAKFDAITD